MTVEASLGRLNVGRAASCVVFKCSLQKICSIVLSFFFFQLFGKLMNMYAVLGGGEKRLSYHAPSSHSECLTPVLRILLNCNQNDVALPTRLDSTLLPELESLASWLRARTASTWPLLTVKL